MKKVFSISALALAITSLIVSCGKPLKDVSDYFPVVKIISFTPELDGSITITGEVVSSGSMDLEYVGMCFSESGTPGPGEDQKLASTAAVGRFTINYAGYTTSTGSYSELDPTAHYYVRAFATNDNGYTWSTVFNITPWTVPSIDPPCTPTINTFNMGSGTNAVSVSGPSTINGTYDYTLNGNTADVKFMFGGPLTTGLYTTASPSSFLTSHQVAIQITQFNIYTISPGTSVYVEEISNNYFNVTVCSAPFPIGSSTGSFTCRFQKNG